MCEAEAQTQKRRRLGVGESPGRLGALGRWQPTPSAAPTSASGASRGLGVLERRESTQCSPALRYRQTPGDSWASRGREPWGLPTPTDKGAPGPFTVSHWGGSSTSTCKSDIAAFSVPAPLPPSSRMDTARDLLLFSCTRKGFGTQRLPDECATNKQMAGEWGRVKRWGAEGRGGRGGGMRADQRLLCSPALSSVCGGGCFTSGHTLTRALQGGPPHDLPPGQQLPRVQADSHPPRHVCPPSDVWEMKELPCIVGHPHPKDDSGHPRQAAISAPHDRVTAAPQEAPCMSSVWLKPQTHNESLHFPLTPLSS